MNVMDGRALPFVTLAWQPPCAAACEQPERAGRYRAPVRVASERRTPRLRAQDVRAPPRGDGAESKTFYILERNIRKQ